LPRRAKTPPLSQEGQTADETAWARTLTLATIDGYVDYLRQAADGKVAGSHSIEAREVLASSVQAYIDANPTRGTQNPQSRFLPASVWGAFQNLVDWDVVGRLCAGDSPSGIFQSTWEVRGKDGEIGKITLQADSKYEYISLYVKGSAPESLASGTYRALFFQPAPEKPFQSGLCASVLVRGLSEDLFPDVSDDPGSTYYLYQNRWIPGTLEVPKP